MIELLAGYLGGLKNADHFGVVTQINTLIQQLETENQVFLQAANGLNTAITAEDVAYKKTQKDWNVERLKDEDKKMDDLMIGTRSILAGHAAMPDGEALKQPAREILQLWKDFNFKTNDSYSGESSKIINIYQEVAKRQSDAEALGVWTYLQKARQQAVTVQSLLALRFDELSSRVVGELKEARANTDAAVKQVYQIVNSLQILMPSAEITALAQKLKAVEDYAKQYYLKSSTSSDGGEPTPTPDGGGSDDGGSSDGGSDGGSDVTPVTPEPTPTPTPTPSGDGDE